MRMWRKTKNRLKYLQVRNYFEFLACWVQVLRYKRFLLKFEVLQRILWYLLRWNDVEPNNFWKKLKWKLSIKCIFRLLIVEIVEIFWKPNYIFLDLFLLSGLSFPGASFYNFFFAFFDIFNYIISKSPILKLRILNYH